jgi:hypothetical protein
MVVAASQDCHNPPKAGTPSDAKLHLLLSRASPQHSPLSLIFSSLRRQAAVKAFQESVR